MGASHLTAALYRLVGAGFKPALGYGTGRGVAPSHGGCTTFVVDNSVGYGQGAGALLRLRLSMNSLLV